MDERYSVIIEEVIDELAPKRHEPHWLFDNVQLYISYDNLWDSYSLISYRNGWEDIDVFWEIYPRRMVLA